MNITFQELRKIKHQLPTGSISRIASDLSLSEQTVRNYFGANKFKEGDFVGKHVQLGPNGGIVNIENDAIINAAISILQSGKTAH